MEGEELGIQRMAKTGVHVQRYPGEAVVEKRKDLLDTETEKVDDTTSKTYRLSKEQLVDLLAQSLSHYADDPGVDTGDITSPETLPAEVAGGEDTVFYNEEIYPETTERSRRHRDSGSPTTSPEENGRRFGAVTPRVVTRTPGSNCSRHRWSIPSHSGTTSCAISGVRSGTAIS